MRMTRPSAVWRRFPHHKWRAPLINSAAFSLPPPDTHTTHHTPHTHTHTTHTRTHILKHPFGTVERPVDVAGDVADADDVFLREGWTKVVREGVRECFPERERVCVSVYVCVCVCVCVRERARERASLPSESVDKQRFPTGVPRSLETAPP
jgi:hypothetical protein